MAIHPRAALKRGLLAVTLVLVVALAALPATAVSKTSGYPITIEIRQTATGDRAMPFNFAIQPGREIVLRIRNYTRDMHTFVLPGIDLNVAVPKGNPQAPSTTEVRFVVRHYGVYRWFCWTCRYGLHMHNRMSGKFYAWISPDLGVG